MSRRRTEKAYMTIYIRMKNDIIDGVYLCGSKIPSKRRTAERYGVSVVTVEHAYDLLGEEGYIESRERSGYFVTYREKDAFYGIHSSYSLPLETLHPTADTQTVFPFSVYAKTVRAVLSKYGENILTRPQNKGCEELQTALADYLRRARSISVTAEQIVIGSGAEYLYGLMIQMLGTNRPTALEDPCYEKIRKIYRAYGVTTEYLKMGSEGILSEELSRSKANVLHVTPFNSYPSGVTATASKRQEYIRWATERKGILIEDDYDSEFTVLTKAEDTLFSLEPHRTVFYMNTFTKTVAPSVRVGYLIIPDEWLGVFRGKLGFYACTVPVLEQLVLAELLNDGSFERHINRVRRHKRKTADKTISAP